MITISAASIEHYLEETQEYRMQLLGTLADENITSFHYSYDNGSTWSSALTTSPAATPVIWGEVGTDNYDVFVLIPAADQADIFPTVDLIRDRENPEILFRAVGTTNTVASATAITFNLISGVQIKPNTLNTMSSLSGSPDRADITEHDKKLHVSESVNVIWETAGGEVDGGLEISVKIEWSGNSSLRYAINSQTIYWRDGNAVMDLSDMSYPDGASKAYIARIIITSANPQDPQISLTGEYFCVTKYMAVSDEVAGGEAEGVTGKQVYPQRTELYARAAAEKAIFMDEVITLSQLEAGTGLRLRQRDHEGKKVGSQGWAGLPNGVMPDETPDQYTAENPVDYAKAFNVVLEVDPTALPLPPTPRALQGTINFNNLTGGVAAVTEADNQYGKLRKYTINHNWNLGDSGDINYKEYQTANSFHLEFMHVPTTLDETPFGWSYHDAVPLYATISRNAIEVFCTVKNANVSGLEPALSKDRVEFAGTTIDPVPSYIFEWRLVEVIPNL